MPEARIATILGYAELIDRRRREPADPERDGYCERHHALPRSMGGGEGENLVLLPVREHIEAHLLLARAIGDQAFGRGMAFAALAMTIGKSGEFATIEEAAEAREAAAEAARNPSPETREKIAAGQRGRPKSPEARAALSLATRGRKPSEACRIAAIAAAARRTFSPEIRAKMSAASRGRTMSDEARAKISAAMRGKPKSASHVALMSEARKGVPLAPETREKIAAAMRGREFTPEWRSRISEALRGVPRSPETIAKVAQANRNPTPLHLEHVATGERHLLPRHQVRELLGLSTSEIGNLLAGRSKTAKGFRLVRDQEEAA